MQVNCETFGPHNPFPRSMQIPVGNQLKAELRSKLTLRSFEPVIEVDVVANLRARQTISALMAVVTRSNTVAEIQA
jgi:hypothetical protein